MIKRKKRLFIVIQSLQYLQAEEIFDDEDENILVVLWADEFSQLHSLVSSKIWDKIFWIQLRGTFYEVVKHRRYINKIIDDIGIIDEVIVSSYYNNLMNIFMNHYKNSNKILLEDGNATLTLDTNSYYSGKKTKLKNFILYLFGFDVSPIQKIDIFTTYKCVLEYPPKIAKNLIYNEFSRIKKKIKNLPDGKDVYFINSNYIQLKMIDKKVYIDFLKKSIDRFRGNNIKVILHRFDQVDDYNEIIGYRGTEVIKLKECVEIYFSKIHEKPYFILTAGSGATKTLYDIYRFNVKVFMPKIELFQPKFRKDIKTIVDKLGEKFNVEFL
ncbi:hypothetical protein JCM30471_00670 [Desulfuromonas carbonis]|uniref:hypothetical protein n=1 Tax=Desulfuromonas sp. DDH964 TaxID=1823759 RepID=UPI000AFFA127|nr:hypothetical protein [Desulfuromonas sp. DDH964]